MLIVTVVAAAVIPLLLAVIIGGAAYLAAFVLLHPFDADELERLSAVLPRRAVQLMGWTSAA
ncbi:MAG: hypothetical protein HND48_06065 [Chloroflexi bacterium]|nr:hypothetical protein [Chloroflexota bacterium]